MSLTLGITLAFITALLWAIADFLAKLLMDKNESEYYVLAFISLSGALSVLVISMVTGNLENLFNYYILGLIGLSVLEFLAFTMYLKSLKYGRLDIAMPIAYSSAAITAILGIIFYKEILSLPQILSIVGILAGIFILSYKGKKIIKHWSILVAVGSMILYGIYYFLLKIPLQTFNAFTVTWVLGLTTGLMALFYALITKKQFLPAKGVGMSSLIGILVSIGMLTFVLGIQIAPVSIVAPIKSTAPVIGIILAVTLLGERLNKREGIGVILAIIGMILLSVFI